MGFPPFYQREVYLLMFMVLLSSFPWSSLWLLLGPVEWEKRKKEKKMGDPVE